MKDCRRKTVLTKTPETHSLGLSAGALFRRSYFGCASRVVLDRTDLLPAARGSLRPRLSAQSFRSLVAYRNPNSEIPLLGCSSRGLSLNLVRRVSQNKRDGHFWTHVEVVPGRRLLYFRG